MSKKPFSADAIRQALLERAEDHARRFNLTLSFISHHAVKDNKFLAEVQRGRNFRIESYQRVIDWIEADAVERKTGVAA